MESLHHILEYSAEAIDIVALAMMGIGAIKFILLYIPIELSRLTGNPCVYQMLAARRVLGGYILAGLEFMIVADVISTVLSHSLDDLYALGAIVVIRTAIGYFLGKELAELGREGSETE